MEEADCCLVPELDGRRLLKLSGSQWETWHRIIVDHMMETFKI